MRNGKTTSATIEVPALKIAEAQVRIIGISPLIVHAFPEKARKEMLGKQMGKAKAGKVARIPEEEYEAAKHKLSDGRCGFPAIGVKLCAIRGGKALGMVMADLRGAFHICAEDLATQLVAIEGEPHMREDVARPQLGTTMVVFRPCFERWAINMRIEYNTGVVSLEQVLACLNAGGFGVGLGDWRPENNGTYGRFRVATSED